MLEDRVHEDMAVRVWESREQELDGGGFGQLLRQSQIVDELA